MLCRFRGFVMQILFSRKSEDEKKTKRCCTVSGISQKRLQILRSGSELFFNEKCNRPGVAYWNHDTVHSGELLVSVWI